MDEQQSAEKWEAHVHRVAQTLAYPPTPDLAGAMRRQLATRGGARQPALNRRHLAWATLAVVCLIVGLMAVPPMQTRFMEMIGLGTGHSLFANPTPTLATSATPTLTVTGLPSPTSMLLTVTPQPSSKLATPTQAAVRLPTYSPDWTLFVDGNQAGGKE